MSNAAKRHMQRVSELGCLICGSPAQLHHPRMAEAKGKKASDWLVVPLCSAHHHPPEGIHAPRTFYTRHRLDEMDLLALTIERLNK